TRRRPTQIEWWSDEEILWTWLGDSDEDKEIWWLALIGRAERVAASRFRLDGGNEKI
ncbi:unnamed protein product, partial [Citrullus colocynthis]